MTGDNLQDQENQPKASAIQRLIFWTRRLYKKVLCFLGFHAWTLCSAPKGKPKYWCRRCDKLSKTLW